MTKKYDGFISELIGICKKHDVAVFVETSGMIGVYRGFGCPEDVRCSLEDHTENHYLIKGSIGGDNAND